MYGKKGGQRIRFASQQSCGWCPVELDVSESPGWRRSKSNDNVTVSCGAGARMVY